MLCLYCRAFWSCSTCLSLHMLLPWTCVHTMLFWIPHTAPHPTPRVLLVLHSFIAPCSIVLHTQAKSDVSNDDIVHMHMPLCIFTCCSICNMLHRIHTLLHKICSRYTPHATVHSSIWHCCCNQQYLTLLMHTIVYYTVVAYNSAHASKRM